MPVVCGRARNVERHALRGRRSALHQRMGPRLPARLPPHRRAARAFPARAVSGVHRDRDRSRARRHRRAPGVARPGRPRRQLQPPEPHLSRHPQAAQSRRPDRLAARAARRRRHRLRRQPRRRPTIWPRRSSTRASRRCRTTPASTRTTRSRHQERFIRDEARVDLRDRRLRHGHRQEQRALRDALRPAQAASRATTRRPAAPAATAAGASACCSSATATWRSSSASSRKRRDEAERAVAREQLERMTRYAYSNDCRRRDLLAYFGESWTSRQLRRLR